MKKRILSICFLVISTVYPTMPVFGGFADTIKRIKPAIVGIGTYHATRAQPLALGGTGFAVADGQHIVTNYHVISRVLDDRNKERYVIFVGQGTQSKVYDVRIIGIDKAHDLALLKFEGRPLPALSLKRDENVREGEIYAFTGFPIGAVLGLYPVTHQGMISAITPIAIPMNRDVELKAELIQQLRSIKPYNVYQLDAIAYPGNSGSPLYDTKTGEVVAVLNSVLVKRMRENALTNPSGISYAIPVKYIKQLLDEVL
jgi:S1-C subfamily serine protease